MSEAQSENAVFSIARTRCKKRNVLCFQFTIVFPSCRTPVGQLHPVGNRADTVQSIPNVSPSRPANSPQVALWETWRALRMSPGKRRSRPFWSARAGQAPAHRRGTEEGFAGPLKTCAASVYETWNLRDCMVPRQDIHVSALYSNDPDYPFHKHF